MPQEETKNSDTLPLALGQTLALLQEIFGDSSDFYVKPADLGGVRCAIVLFTGISSPEKLWVMALDAITREVETPVADGPALRQRLLCQSIVPLESKPLETKTALIEKLSVGMSVLLIDGCPGGVAFSTQEMPQRSVSTPNSEGNIRGSQEAFTELLRNNVSLLRRQFRSGTLVAEITTANSRAKTEYCICYDKALASPKMVARLRAELAKIEIPVLLDSAYFASFLKQDKLNLFPAAAYTERPATACARLCEGKLVVLVAGSPFAMVVPSFFSEHFETLDDYSSGAVFSGGIRILKYLAFFLSVFGPGLYLVAVGFAPEMIPVSLLAKLARAEAETPLPLLLEMLGLTLLLEIVREAGLRAPRSIGNTVSLVGALIIGETAVSAGIVSVPVLTMAAAATVATLAVPSLYEQSILFRFFILILSGVAGVPGFACGAVVILAMSCGAAIFELDYLYPLAPLGAATWRDGFVRAIWSNLAKKGYVVGRHEK
ncbi:MAG: spore germination protein [Gemmiger sp.]|nr:spore germination protein [Gemmiger sp.]